MDKNRKLLILEAVSAGLLAAAFAVTFIMGPGTARSVVGLSCMGASWLVSLSGLWLWSRLSKEQRAELDAGHSKWIFPPSFLVKVIPIGLPVALLGLIVSILK